MIVYKSISRAVLIDVICLLPLLESSSSTSGSVLIDRIGLLKISMLVIMLVLVMIMLNTNMIMLILVMIMLIAKMIMLILAMSLLPLFCDCHVAMILAIVGRL